MCAQMSPRFEDAGMPSAISTTAQKGVLEPEELRLLEDVLAATAVPNETDEDREARAALIIANFQAGIKDRHELIAAVRPST